MKRLMLVLASTTMCLASLQAFDFYSHSNQKFLPLESHSMFDELNLKTRSEVVKFIPDSNFLDEFFEYWNKIYGRDMSKETPADFYVYAYVFENLGNNGLKLNFSNWEFIHSPFTDIMQDFSFMIDSGYTTTLVFVANSEPKTVVSPKNAAIWNSNDNTWHILGIGMAGLYIPSDSLSLYKTVRLGVTKNK